MLFAHPLLLPLFPHKFDCAHCGLRAIRHRFGNLQQPALTRPQLFQAGMHVGRDMMGTDSNTLILAFAGSSVSMLVLNYAYDLPYQQIINSNNIGIAVMEGLSGSFGIVLAVPATVLLATFCLTRRSKAD